MWAQSGAKPQCRGLADEDHQQSSPRSQGGEETSRVRLGRDSRLGVRVGQKPFKVRRADSKPTDGQAENEVNGGLYAEWGVRSRQEADLKHSVWPD